MSEVMSLNLHVSVGEKGWTVWKHTVVMEYYDRKICADRSSGIVYSRLVVGYLHNRTVRKYSDCTAVRSFALAEEPRGRSEGYVPPHFLKIWVS